MKRKSYTGEQIGFALRQTESGAPMRSAGVWGYQNRD
jgi:hypothetical protein